MLPPTIEPVKEWRIAILPELSSTQDYALEHSLSHGAAVVALRQVAGRGQRSNVWLSREGDLAISFVVDSHGIPTRRNFALAQLAALTLYDTIATYGLTPCIRWPNDVDVNGHKIGGMIIHHALKASHIATTTIGIGINIAPLQPAGYPFPVPPTALANLLPSPPAPTEAATRLLQAWDKNALRFNCEGMEHVHTRYMGLLPRPDSEGFNRFQQGDLTLRAKLLGCETSGWLRIETEKGELLSCESGSLRMLP